MEVPEFLRSILLRSRQTGLPSWRVPRWQRHWYVVLAAFWQGTVTSMWPYHLKAGKLLNDARKCLQASTPWVLEKQEGRVSGKWIFSWSSYQGGCHISLQRKENKSNLASTNTMSNRTRDKFSLRRYEVIYKRQGEWHNFLVIKYTQS